MGSTGRSSTPTVKLTKTEQLVRRIADGIIVDWIDGSYMDDMDKESVVTWHDLLEMLNMEAKEARQDIIEELESDEWDRIRRGQGLTGLSFDDDGEFEDENGNFIKYGDIMKLVKQRLVERGILQKPR